MDRVEEATGCKLEIVKRPKGERGFKLLAKRWVAERTFARLGRHRRMIKDFGGVDSSGDDLPRAKAAGDVNQIIKHTLRRALVAGARRR